jgi:hypothetical protein
MYYQNFMLLRNTFEELILYIVYSLLILTSHVKFFQSATLHLHCNS